MHVEAQEMYELYARVCKAIAEPMRLSIIEELRDGPRTVGEIVEALGTSQPNASQHLRMLRDRGILTARRDGNNVYYALTSQKIVQALDLLCEFMREQHAPGRRAG
ncbi:ArsR/SmtB family transcription factor [Amycolatopsis acididurans]|nr:metalloregulator ArsR/SmtB family transcription factor [Amycolatopsis acididurans]